jgi:hypothetical protein
MRTGTWILRQPLICLDSVDEPYLSTAMGTLGDHEILLQYASEPKDFRVFLDGTSIYEIGLPTAGEAWFKVCRELGYEPEVHWDLDPVRILFQQVVPALARGWRENPLPFEGSGVPDGVVCLGIVQAAWEAGVDGLFDHLKGTEAGRQAARCFAGLPLRAIVFHDDPSHREDFVGTGVDEPLLGVYLHLGASRSRTVTLAKATLVGTGGLRWSPWELGGEWAEGGREFRATLRPEAFLWAAGLGRIGPRGFDAAFQEALKNLMAQMNPVVDAYRRTYPAGVTWHRDPYARYLNHMIVDVRLENGQAYLVLDDGTEVGVVNLKGGPVLETSS